MRLRLRRVGLAALLWLALLCGATGDAAAKQRIAVFDYGSSSLKVGIFDGKGRLIAQRKYGTALGKGLGADKLLPKTNRDHALMGVDKALAFVATYGVKAQDISFIATAATRNAKGRLSAAQRGAGLLGGRTHVRLDIQGARGITDAKVLTGKQEARLGFRGALVGLKKLGARDEVLVMDFGGNSHQATIGTIKGYRVEGSTQVGSNPIYDTLFQGRTMTPAELVTAAGEVARMVPKFPIDPARAARVKRTVIMGSTAKLLAVYTGKNTITRGKLEKLLTTFAAIPEADRATFFSTSAKGRTLTADERDEIGLSELRPGQRFAEKAPAQLLLVLRNLDLHGMTNATDVVELARTDARHAKAMDVLAARKVAKAATATAAATTKTAKTAKTAAATAP